MCLNLTENKYTEYRKQREHYFTNTLNTENREKKLFHLETQHISISLKKKI